MWGVGRGDQISAPIRKTHVCDNIRDVPISEEGKEHGRGGKKFSGGSNAYKDQMGRDERQRPTSGRPGGEEGTKEVVLIVGRTLSYVKRKFQKKTRLKRDEKPKKKKGTKRKGNWKRKFGRY